MDPITAINLAVTVKGLLDSQGGKKEEQAGGSSDPLAQVTKVLQLVEGPNGVESGDTELLKVLGLA